MLTSKQVSNAPFHCGFAYRWFVIFPLEPIGIALNWSCMFFVIQPSGWSHVHKSVERWKEKRLRRTGN